MMGLRLSTSLGQLQVPTGRSVGIPLGTGPVDLGYPWERIVTDLGLDFAPVGTHHRYPSLNK